MRVRWGDCISSPFRVSNGVRQGGILSPYLFNTTLLRPRQRLEPGTASSRSWRTPIGEQTPELSAPQPWLCVSPLLCCVSPLLCFSSRMMHNLPTYCSASEMFTANGVADCKAVIRNLVHRFMMRLTISKHLLVRSILSSDLVCSSRIRRHWARLL